MTIRFLVGDATLAQSFVKKIRAKLGDNARSPIWICSVRGVGQRMASPREAESPDPSRGAGKPASNGREARLEA